MSTSYYNVNTIILHVLHALRGEKTVVVPFTLALFTLFSNVYRTL